MKLAKTAFGEKLSLSRPEWEAIGRKAGWTSSLFPHESRDFHSPENGHRVFVIHKDGSPSAEFESLSNDEAKAKFDEMSADPNSEIVEWDLALYNTYNKLVGHKTINRKINRPSDAPQTSLAGLKAGLVVTAEEIKASELYREFVAEGKTPEQAAVEVLDIMTNGLFVAVEEPKRSKMIADAIAKWDGQGREARAILAAMRKKAMGMLETRLYKTPADKTPAYALEFVQRRMSELSNVPGEAAPEHTQVWILKPEEFEERWNEFSVNWADKLGEQPDEEKSKLMALTELGRVIAVELDW